MTLKWTEIRNPNEKWFVLSHYSDHAMLKKMIEKSFQVIVGIITVTTVLPFGESPRFAIIIRI